MINRAGLAALAVVLAWLYMWMMLVVTAQAETLHIPSWWWPLFSTPSGAILTWLVIVHTIAVFCASLPFAVAIHFIYGHSGVWIALAMTVAMYSLTILPT